MEKETLPAKRINTIIKKRFYQTATMIISIAMLKTCSLPMIKWSMGKRGKEGGSYNSFIVSSLKIILELRSLRICSTAASKLQMA